MESQFIEANGLRHHVLTAGKGPLVILCHCFPELAWSWRHQIPALAEAGFRVVAPDMRGYGDTKGPAEIGAYTNLHVVGDMVALLDALKEREAVIVGHDWGAPIAWLAATIRPDRFRAVASLSVVRTARPPQSIVNSLRAQGADDFYWLYFQTPGVAEADMERDTRETFSRFIYCISGEAAARNETWNMRVKPTGLMDSLAMPKERPQWLMAEDLERYASTYKRTGFATALNWYRNTEENWEHSAAWADVKITVPALFIGGGDDPSVTRHGKDPEKVMRDPVPGLRRAVVLEKVGHWVQQEAPEAVNRELIAFLKNI